MKRLIERLKELTHNKKVGIVGFGLEGQSTLRFIRQHIGDIPIAIADRDSKIRERTALDISGPGMVLYTGNDYLEKLPEIEILFKSPGIRLPIDFLEKNPGIQVITQTSLVLSEYSEQVIGITGTKGKSTTSSLIHHILSLSGKDNLLIGNIGVPAFDNLHLVQPGTIIVFELSSHQLENITVSPHISILTNLYPEHLDRYASAADYFRSKWNIFQHQGHQDFRIICDEIPLSRLPGEDIPLQGKLLRYGLQDLEEDGAFMKNGVFGIKMGNKVIEKGYLRNGLYLKGRHNQLNALAALMACYRSGVTFERILEAMSSFQGLEHRLEYVGNYGGINFYNDSIATIPEATIEAVRAIEDISTLILGGYDRMLEYTPLIQYLMETDIRNFIFMGQAGKRMHMAALEHPGSPKHKLFLVETLEEAFQIIKAETPIGSACLLSPAAASYDSFNNFEERGRLFKQIARTL